MSPEQARGQEDLSAQSDQFSLGLVLYELASGRRAFQRGSAVETMTAIIREDAEPLPATVLASSAIHPDGKTVVFSRDGRAWVSSLKGGTPKELPLVSGNVSSTQFPPDGNRLAVVSDSGIWFFPGLPVRPEISARSPSIV